MRKQMVAMFLVLSCGMLFANGCAKHELVKKDEPIAPAAAAEVKPPLKTEAAKMEPVKPDVVKPQPVMQSPLKESAV